MLLTPALGGSKFVLYDINKKASDLTKAFLDKLAERLGVTPVSANEMVKRLEEQGLVSHTPYKGVGLTKKGREAACSVIRRQRLWECFLYDHLKIEWAQVYEFACSLEHATAPEVTEALAGFLGDPKTCPRGNPIPAADGSFKPLDALPLSELKLGQAARVVAVNATVTDVLKYLQEKNILPGREVAVVEVAPMQGPLTLRVAEKDVAMGLAMAEFVLVKIKKN
jgi:DtxR family Mn-dependent transcriptional regulator